MSLVSEIKCARCDRKYSGVRSRCPYCGARRIGRGKYTEDSENAKGKMLISVLVMGVLVVAAGVLLFTTPIDAEAGLPPVIEEPSSGLGDLEDIDTLPGLNPLGPSEPDDEEDINDALGEPPQPPAAPEVRDVVITFQNRRIEDFTERVGNSIVLGVRVEPIGIEEPIIWMSGDTSVFEVVATNPEGTSARVTAISHGDVYLTVSVGGVEARCMVRVRR